MPGKRKRPAAVTVCSKPGCPELAPAGESTCSLHRPEPWRDARQRRPRSGSGWSEQKLHREILEKYHRICHVCGKSGADEVDHVRPKSEGGTDTPDNLRPIHSDPCHKEKTRLESQKGKSRG